MSKRALNIILLLALSGPIIYSQTDIVPPAPPVLRLVSVNQATGFSEISWALSPSPDVSGYVVYYFINDEAYAIDTIRNPLISDYTHASLISSELSRSYVVAAIDSSGNISTLSNILNTIYTTALLDSCNSRIEIKWNSYPSWPMEVTGYTILSSLNGGVFSESGTVSRDINVFIINDFSFDSQYCFIVRANLEGGYSSHSSRRCLSTKMQKPPLWINADYATVTPENEIMLSFTIDPAAEIRTYILERKTGASGEFGQIYNYTGDPGTFIYNDGSADISTVNFYRLSAVNNCSIPVISSNLASNIVLGLTREEDDIILSWNPYREWTGMVSSYSICFNTGEGYEERYSVPANDTSFTFGYSGIMYEVSGNEVCFRVVALEGPDIHVSSAESRSSVICTDATELITVPNAFTPDNNQVNDLFMPVLSFTPADYHLLITDMRRKKVFESRDHLLSWDGTAGGEILPEGVYLWFLEVVAPSGKVMARTGTVTIIRPGR